MVHIVAQLPQLPERMTSITAPLSIWQAAGYFMNTEGQGGTPTTLAVTPQEVDTITAALDGTATPPPWAPNPPWQYVGQDRQDYYAGYSDSWHRYQFGAGHAEPSDAYRAGWEAGTAAAAIGWQFTPRSQ